jgi:hypothetical protein
VSAPGELLKEHEAAIAENPRIKPDTLRRVRRRIEYQDWPADQLWNEFQAFCRRSDENPESDVDLDYAEDLIRDLARHDTPDAETLFGLIREPTKKGSWSEIFVIDLAGKRRLSELVVPLVELLHEDNDLILEDSPIALARIGDVEAVRLIRRDFPNAPEHFRLFASSVLGWVRHAEAESAILEVLEGEKDDSNRIWLCSALCDQISERCLEVVGREIASGDSMVRHELSSTLLVVATILGQELPPEAVEWKVTRDRQRESMTRYLSGESSWESEEEVDASGFLRGTNSSASLSAGAPATIRNTGERVGRNDPCPCGSGKKFKKCHGKA